VADQVDAAMNWVKPARRDAVIYRALAQPGGEQLSPRDDSMLPPRDPRRRIAPENLNLNALGANGLRFPPTIGANLNLSPVRPTTLRLSGLVRDHGP
jgi:hypothetical protein